MPYTDEDIEELEKCPCVLNVTHRRLVLELELKCEVYKEWCTSGRNTKAVRSALKKRGFNIYRVRDRYCSDLNQFFKAYGARLKRILIRCLNQKSN